MTAPTLSIVRSGAPQRGAELLVALERLWASPGWRAYAIALLLALPAPLIVAACPTFIINFNMHDMFIPLDAAWRTLQGQWPHQDVYTPLGVMYFWQHGLAAWLWGLDGKTVTRASFVALPVVMVPFLVYARPRLGTLSVVVLTSFLTLLVTAPTFIDGPAVAISHVASYNRDGAALCAVIAVWALAPVRPGAVRWPWLEGVLLGVSLWVLLYLKVTFFLLAVAFALLGCVVQRRLWSTAAGAAALVVVGVGVIEAVHPGLSAKYLADLHRTGASTYNVFRWAGVQSVLLGNAPMILITIAVAAGVIWLRPHKLHACAILAAAFAACLVSMQNYGAYSAPLAVLVVCQLEVFRLGLQHDLPFLAVPFRAFATGLVVLVALPFIALQTSGTLYMYQKRFQTKHIYPMGGGLSKTLANVVWYPNEVLPEFASVDQALAFPLARIGAEAGSASVTDGLELIHQFGLQGKRVATLAFENPFPFALRAPSPRGIGLWWDFNRTFLVNGTTTPEMLIGDADVVMYPKFWFEDYISVLLKNIARPELERDFVPHESRCWTMWVRKSTAAGQ